MDAAGLSQAAVLGMSEGGLIAQLFTVLHPERVSRLVLVNSAPGTTGRLHAFGSSSDPREGMQTVVARLEQLVATWGRDPQFMVDWFVPTHTTDPAFVRWMGRLQRQTATSADIRRQILSLRELDAAPVLHQIAVPTLLVHNIDDQVVPVAGSRFLAERIPGAQLVELPGQRSHGRGGLELAASGRHVARVRVGACSAAAVATAAGDCGVHRHRRLGGRHQCPRGQGVAIATRRA